ncbi:hypothetical protein ACWV95_32685 [Streptomyces albus]
MNDTLIRDAELLVTMDGDEIPGGWVALREGTVTGTGRPAPNRGRPAPFLHTVRW